MGFLTTVEMSEKWNITRRRIAELCKEGRIEGVLETSDEIEKENIFAATYTDINGKD